MADKILLTQQGLLKLQDELKNLKEVKRVEIAKKLKEAISFGDLSENSEYEDARNEQATVEKRISDLEVDLKNVEIIKEDNTSKNKVTIGSIVEIENTSISQKEKFKIVGSTEANILADLPRISNESAVGISLLGKKKGETIIVNSNSGKVEYKIVSLEK